MVNTYTGQQKKMAIKLESLIEIIVREVLKQLHENGTEVDISSFNSITNKNINVIVKSRIIDMSGFKTPVLLEKHIAELKEEEITIPAGTVITPAAGYLIKKKKIKINYLTNTHE
jgi:hypothetical protein